MKIGFPKSGRHQTVACPTAPIYADSPASGPAVQPVTSAVPETSSAPKGVIATNAVTSAVYRKLMDELDSLGGLAEAKEYIRTRVNLVQVHNARIAKNLPTQQMSHHVVFTGNPGTGKATVARIVGELYQDLGVLAKGHLVATNRAGLVGQDEAETINKVNGVLDAALDGVLFIQDAHNLNGGYGDNLGCCAIDQLLSRMDSDANRVVVIVAGDPYRMSRFVDADPDLSAVFPNIIYFPDIGDSEMAKIFEGLIRQNQLNAPEEFFEQAQVDFQKINRQENRTFSNDRRQSYVKEYFDKTLRNQANRIMADGLIEPGELENLMVSDLPSVAA